MERKLSKFCVGDRVTTMQAVRNWAGFQTGILQVNTVETVEERKTNIKGETVFYYKTSAGPYTQEENLIPAERAKDEAIRFLTSSLETIARWQGGEE